MSKILVFGIKNPIRPGCPNFPGVGTRLFDPSGYACDWNQSHEKQVHEQDVQEICN